MSPCPHVHVHVFFHYSPIRRRGGKREGRFFLSISHFSTMRERRKKKPMRNLRAGNAHAGKYKRKQNPKRTSRIKTDANADADANANANLPPPLPVFPQLGPLGKTQTRSPPPYLPNTYTHTHT